MINRCFSKKTVLETTAKAKEMNLNGLMISRKLMKKTNLTGANAISYIISPSTALSVKKHRW